MQSQGSPPEPASLLREQGGGAQAGGEGKAGVHSRKESASSWGGGQGGPGSCPPWRLLRACLSRVHLVCAEGVGGWHKCGMPTSACLALACYTQHRTGDVLFPCLVDLQSRSGSPFFE